MLFPRFAGCGRCVAFPPSLLRYSRTPRPLQVPFPVNQSSNMSAQHASSADGSDLIFVRSLNLKANTGNDAWQRPKLQPILLSLWLKTSVALAGSTDHLPYSIHYGIVTKTVSKFVESGSFRNIQHLAEDVSQLAFNELKGKWVKVVVEQPKGLLKAESAGISIERQKEGEKAVVVGEDRALVNDLKLYTIIGVNPWEREDKQQVIVNLAVYGPDGQPLENNYNLLTVVKRVEEHIEGSDYQTIEALVTGVARVACVECQVRKITVRAEKPSALTFAKAAGVEITRERGFFEVTDTGRVAEGKHDVILALGSNMGDRLELIKKAIKELERRGHKVKRTSNLYQSAPMYVTDQPTFLNGACQIETTLTPNDLLREVKDIEDTLGRVKIIEKGPRSIDLDILLYDNLTMQSEVLTIPHASMLEREFVLRPLCDIIPNRAHPLTSTSFKNHLAALPPQESPLSTFISLSPDAAPLNPSDPHRKPLLMAVLNLTPDSFSDGGKHSEDTLIPTVQSFVEAGADIVDIGGQSTRPGAIDVGEEEELKRVIPSIKAIREAGIKTPISVDTYRASVARAAIDAGANIINDISAGAFDPTLFSTVAELGCPIVLMHTRGTPKTMNSMTTYDDLVRDVAHELAQRVREAEDAGIRRWNIILDPGLGFAKIGKQNTELIKRLPELISNTEIEGMPWLLGPSRKKFVGTITGVEKAAERQWGTAGAVAACVAGGADIVRVHDVKEMKGVIDMAAAVWRS